MRTQLLSSGLLLLLLGGPITATQAQLDTAGSPRDCSVLLYDGRKIHADRFWRIETERVEYEEDGSLHDLLVSDIWSVHCSELEYEILSGSIRPLLSAVPIPAIEPGEVEARIDYFALGKADAAKYYNGAGAFAAGFLTAPMLLVPPIIAAVPPHLNTTRNPNAALYRTNDDYLKGYRRKAHGKKAGFTILGMSVGLMALIALASQ